MDGLVYEAEQETPRRRVAFKVIPTARPQAVDCGCVFFRREAETLARLVPSRRRRGLRGRPHGGIASTF